MAPTFVRTFLLRTDDVIALLKMHEGHFSFQRPESASDIHSGDVFVSDHPFGDYGLPWTYVDDESDFEISQSQSMMRKKLPISYKGTNLYILAHYIDEWEYFNLNILIPAGWNPQPETEKEVYRSKLKVRRLCPTLPRLY